MMTKDCGDDYEWPSLIEVCRDLLSFSVVIYTLAEIRGLARKGLLSEEHAKRIMSLPITTQDIDEIVLGNEEAIQSIISDGVSLMAFHTFLQQNPEYRHLRENQLKVLDDEDGGLVYGISVNPLRKRITVSFRGSVTAKEFLIDANSFLVDMRLPSGRKVSIHSGFYDYLFGKQDKCKAILTQVASLLEQYPGYRLYTTGHSLGAALATLFAVHAVISEDFDIPTPVTCINVASPKCGDATFKKAFQSLQNEGLIHSLRIRNYEDMIPQKPDRNPFSFYRFFCCRHVVFRHVGSELVLKSNGSHEISYPQEDDGLLEEMRWQLGSGSGSAVQMGVAFCYKAEFLRYHSCLEYMTRFNKFAQGKGELRLSDILNEG